MSASDAATGAVVLIPTYRRPEPLRRLLTALAAQTLPPRRVVVCDNDPEGGAAAVCAEFDVETCAEARPGVVAVRNALLEQVGDEPFLAFVDDDEIPPPHWLDTLVRTAIAERVDVVGAPVTPIHPRGTDHWTVRHDAHAHGNRARGRDLVLLPSTNNCVVRTAAWRRAGAPRFDPRFGATGGEDTELFARLRRAGLTFFWEPAAEIVEEVAADRVSTAWFVRRGLQNGWVHGTVQLQDRSALRVVAGGGARIASGLLRLAIAVPRRRSPVPGLRRVLAGAGFLRAVLRLPTDAYGRTPRG